jgi:mercuric ion transport protein
MVDGRQFGGAPGTESRLLSYVGLFSSVGTLVCCALPSLLVLLGFGATVASALAAAPWLVTLSRHKGWVFAVAGLLIAGNFYYVYRLAPRLLVARGACPADDPAACAAATRVSRGLLWASATLFLAGFAVAYLLPLVLDRVYA